MRYELRRLPRKNEFFGSVIGPSSNSFDRRRSVKYAVELRRTESSRVELKVETKRNRFREKRAAPGAITPSGRPDEALRGLACHCLLTSQRQARRPMLHSNARGGGYAFI